MKNEHPESDGAPREAYPLTWPAGRSRTPPERRKASAFRPLGFAVIRDALIKELRRLAATEVILSTNLPVRRDGLPYADSREPADTGVSIYFKRHKRPFVLACDTYDKVWKNLRAIHATVEALRTIERHGSTEMLEQAFTGFAQLPAARAAEPSWWETLGLFPEATIEEIDDAHAALALQHHPDRGGDFAVMARINRARDVAREERRGAPC